MGSEGSVETGALPARTSGIFSTGKYFSEMKKKKKKEKEAGERTQTQKKETENERNHALSFPVLFFSFLICIFLLVLFNFFLEGALLGRVEFRVQLARDVCA